MCVCEMCVSVLCNCCTVVQKTYIYIYIYTHTYTYRERKNITDGHVFVRIGDVMEVDARKMYVCVCVCVCVYVCVCVCVCVSYCQI